MTPKDFKSARQTLGLSSKGMARALQVESGRTIRRWEAGDREIPGPAIVALTFMLRTGVLDPAELPDPPPRPDRARNGTETHDDDVEEEASDLDANPTLTETAPPIVKPTRGGRKQAKAD